MNIKVGDKVVILAGKDKGKVSEVIASFPKESRVAVKGVNIVSRHKKPRSAKEKGGIIKFEGKIDVSNAQVICSKCNKTTRVAHAFDEKGKHRACKKCGASLDSGKKVVAKSAKSEVKELKTIKNEDKKEAVKAEAKKPAAKAVPSQAKQKYSPASTVNTTLKKPSANAVKQNVKNKTVSSSGK